MAEALSEAAAMDVEEYITTVPVPDSKLVGFVIGRSGRTIDRLMNDTTTYIHYENQTNTFIIEGEAENRYAAKLKIKEIISNGLKTQTEDYKECRRFPFVHSSGSGFVLQPVDSNLNFFQVKLKDPFNEDQSSYSTDCSSFLSQMIKVLESIHEESGRKEDVTHNIWSHFGHIYLSYVNHDEMATEFDAQELLRHVKWENTSNATKWRTKFVGGIVDGLEHHNLNGWMTNQTEKGIPFIRYEFVYFTPSCRVIRVKVGIVQCLMQSLSLAHCFASHLSNPIPMGVFLTSPSAPKLWNTIPEHIKRAETETFNLLGALRLEIC